MSLQERFKAIDERPRGVDPVDLLLGKMDAETGALLLSLLGNSNVSIRSIHDALREEKFSIARESLTKYRKKLLTS